ncbi:PR domain zinc finger protein 10 isoform X6 [Mauremys reevesii]|uniref:PR domain zinc finger protein 10 isoform X6 n=1 Tax=Mauremys reevesii TaxID=260615 RepID=UPI00193FB16E|nr:PR domain zinc finger protein 10 isoform X6 [Mauremys reevesii]
MEHHSRDEMDSKEESPQVWSESAEQEQNTAQVHFVPEGGAVAQIVYSDDQDRPPQQVVYTADGTSYTSVDTSEHTLVYIHPVEATQSLFTDPSQVAYVQQDATTQQVTVLLPAAAQSMNSTNLSVLGNVAESPQQMALEQGPQADRASLPVHNQVLPPMEAVDGSDPLAPLQNPMGRMETKEEDDDDDEDDEDEDEDGEDTDLDEWDPDPPRPFDPHDLWCEECNNAHPSVCPKHGPLHPIPNRPVLTRARASLPLVLYIDRFLGGVFSKRRIPKRTQFGPVEGPLVRQMELKDCYIHLKVSLEKGDRKDRDLQEDLWFELSSEALCNWMMFVRPAQNHLEQNLVAYQYGHHIYYTTIKNVEPKQELKVWYAASYAEFVNQKIHDISEEERKVLRDQEKNWPCYECNRRFMSSEQLQQHLNSHDEKLDFFSRARGRGRGRGKRRFGPGRRPGRPPKFMRLEVTSENGEKCEEGTQDLLNFSSKGQFDEAGQATLNGLEQQEQTPVPPETQSALDQQPEGHPMQLQQQQHDENPVPMQSTMTADDMRRAKRIRRKDKLREHMQRMHNPEREAKKADRISRSKTFKPRIASTDYESFMFKCRLCMMGFRRRGMLVNHLSKRHPDMKIEEVPELTLPIIKPNRDYFCQYCDKVYKSASKRKAHILKNHPGAELPPSIRKLRPAGPGEPDPMLSTHTQLTGTIATPPVCCPHCSKQYSSKTKMVQHIRKKHPEFAQLPNTIHTPLAAAVISSTPAVLTTDSTTGETVVTTDLLTQAMTELSQTLTTDYRTPQGDYQRIQYIPVSQSTAGLQQPQHIQLQVVQVAQATSPHQSQHSTVDVGQLHDPQTYTQHAIQVQHIQVTEPAPTTQSSSQVGAQPLSPSSQQSQQELSPSQMQTTTSAPSQTLQQQQGSSVQHTYLPSTWNSFRSYPSEIQMMAIPQGQYVIAETAVGTPVTTVNTGQVKAVTQTHYVISEGQPDLDVKQNSSLSSGVQVGVSQPSAHCDPLESQTTNQQQTTQYIITTTTNGNGGSEVHITKPRTFSTEQE